VYLPALRPVLLDRLVLCTGIVHAGGVDPSERWYGQQAVYRVSLGNFVRPAHTCALARHNPLQRTFCAAKYCSSAASVHWAQPMVTRLLTHRSCSSG